MFHKDTLELVKVASVKRGMRATILAVSSDGSAVLYGEMKDTDYEENPVITEYLAVQGEEKREIRKKRVSEMENRIGQASSLGRTITL